LARTIGTLPADANVLRTSGTSVLGFPGLAIGEL
jgi:hypothetical protein